MTERELWTAFGAAGSDEELASVVKGQRGLATRTVSARRATLGSGIVLELECGRARAIFVGRGPGDWRAGVDLRNGTRPIWTQAGLELHEAVGAVWFLAERMRAAWEEAGSFLANFPEYAGTVAVPWRGESGPSARGG